MYIHLLHQWNDGVVGGEVVGRIISWLVAVAGAVFWIAVTTFYFCPPTQLRQCDYLLFVCHTSNPPFQLAARHISVPELFRPILIPAGDFNAVKSVFE